MLFPTLPLARVPVWVWRALMSRLAPRELRRFTADPIGGVDYRIDIDYAGDGIPEHRLDVLRPTDVTAALPVYVYFHGGGWTSGDKAPLTRYCASQARDGMVVVNVNYRRAPRFHMEHMLRDANEALTWVREHIEAHGGDPDRLVLGGDSAGGQIAALLAAVLRRPELATHYSMMPTVPAASIRGVVQHCSIAAFRISPSCSTKDSCSGSDSSGCCCRAAGAASTLSAPPDSCRQSSGSTATTHRFS